MTIRKTVGCVRERNLDNSRYIRETVGISVRTTSKVKKKCMVPDNIPTVRTKEIRVLDK